jgi:hypothetical protein
VTTDHFQNVLRLFGAYKAEWLNGQLFDLFRAPHYFSQLSSTTPCVLIGGRGTGKTTVLKGLSYQGQFALHNRKLESMRSWPFIGLYHRVNTNRVSAFRGPELTEDEWTKCFSHYMNLTFCGQVLEFTKWLITNTNQQVGLDPSVLKEVCASLCLPFADTVDQLREEVRVAQAAFEAAVNNIGETPPRNLSVAAAPVDTLVLALTQTPAFQGRSVCFLLDEFENFDDYQQRVVNTFIKHSSTSCTFKIGVRELGWRDRRTVNAHEILRHPADYARISIDAYMDAGGFEDFARQVCQGRLAAAGADGDAFQVPTMLPAIGLDDEVQLLGARDQINKCRQDILAEANPDESIFASKLSPSKLFFLQYWAETNGRTLRQEFERAFRDTSRWEQDYTNHAFASVFCIRRGKTGIRKHYAGWEVFTKLANGNIRFLLELVHTSLAMHAELGKTLNLPVSWDTQTRAAQDVARKNLGELEGLSVEGARLTKLILSLGRVFQVLAEQPAGHAPEVNQFQIAWGDITASEEASRLEHFLRVCVMHLALVRVRGTKPTEDSDTKEYDYMLHPIFAPMFVYSHRRKRKMTLSADDFWGLITSPSATIEKVLSRTKRTLDVELPDQLLLFENYYGRIS